MGAFSLIVVINLLNRFTCLFFIVFVTDSRQKMATAADRKDITNQIGNIDLKQEGMEERKLSRPTRQPLKLEPGKNNNLLVEQVVGLQRHGTGVNNKLWVLCKWENKEELNWVEHALLDCDDLIADYIAAKYTQHLAEKENK